MHTYGADVKSLDFLYTPDDPKLDHLAKGRLYVTEKDLEGAVTSFEAAVKFHPSSKEAWVALAGALENVGWGAMGVTGAGLGAGERAARAEKCRSTARGLKSVRKKHVVDGRGIRVEL
jgi:hypothetical protein